MLMIRASTHTHTHQSITKGRWMPTYHLIISNPPPSLFLYCRLKMRRIHILSPLLLLCLVLVASQHIYATSSTFQQTKTGSFKMATAAYNSGNARGNSQKVERYRKVAYEEKVRKTPSGPSPLGNNRPPTKA